MACTYQYIAYQDEGYWVVHTPQVPVVYGWAKTYQAAYKDFVDALTTMLEFQRETSSKKSKSCPVPPFRIGKVRI